MLHRPILGVGNGYQGPFVPAGTTASHAVPIARVAPTKRYQYRDEPSRHRLITVEHAGTQYRMITFDREDARELRHVVSVVGRLLRRHRPLCERVTVRGRKVLKKTPLCRELLEILRGWAAEVMTRVGDKQRMHPYFEVFTELMMEMRVPIDCNEVLPEALDTFVAKLKERCSEGAVRRRIDNAKRVARDNTRSAMQLLRFVRTGYSKVLALRFDLEYLAEYAPSLHPRPLAEELMKAHREEILDLLREGPYAKHLIGYVWKTEWGLERGFHHHVLVLLDGQAVRADIRIVDDIGHRWKNDVTHGAGCFHNCNKDKELYQRCGIGMLNRADDERWAYLEEATAYLTKNDMYTKTVLCKSTQCFGVGGPYICGTGAPAKRKRRKGEGQVGTPKAT